MFQKNMKNGELLKISRHKYEYLKFEVALVLIKFNL